MGATTGERIKRLRTAHGWSQRQLAERLGCVQASVCHWEMERSMPSLHRLQRIARLCDVPVAWLVGDSDDEVATDE